jgi:hypothetical protein
MAWEHNFYHILGKPNGIENCEKRKGRGGGHFRTHNSGVKVEEENVKRTKGNKISDKKRGQTGRKWGRKGRRKGRWMGWDGN